MSEFVSEQILEALLSEIAVYCVSSCANRRASQAAPKIAAAAALRTTALSTTSMTASPTSSASARAANATPSLPPPTDEQKTVAAEMAAAKLERMGFVVGYRFTERLAQHKTWNSLLSQDAAAQTAAQQLEAVKFLCKDVWVSVFGKQIDKLQTNHRGVFVLKDLKLLWLQHFPATTEASRTKAMQLLAFPCGLIRGSLANLGIPAVVSCDFLANGQDMDACSFNIKVK